MGGVTELSLVPSAEMTRSDRPSAESSACVVMKQCTMCAVNSTAIPTQIVRLTIENALSLNPFLFVFVWPGENGEVGGGIKMFMQISMYACM